jgi:hypothetical protein
MLFRMIDLVVVVLCSLLVLTLIHLGAVQANKVADRVACANNLRQIAGAFLMYSDKFSKRGAPFPRATYEMGVEPPVWGTPYANDGSPGAAPDAADPFVSSEKKDPSRWKFVPKKNDITASLFLLLRQELVRPEVFVCPATVQTPLSFGPGKTAKDWTNFPGQAGIANHLSYSVQNMFFSVKSIQNGSRWNATLAGEMVILSDMNPGTDSVLAVSAKSTAEQLRSALSFNHHQEGQNVATANGSVEWVGSPRASQHGDNIFVAGDPFYGSDPNKNLREGAKPTILSSSFDAADSILLPTSTSVGNDASISRYADKKRSPTTKSD